MSAEGPGDRVESPELHWQIRNLWRDTEFAFRNGSKYDSLQSLPLKMSPAARAEWDEAVASGRLVPVMQRRLVSTWRDHDPQEALPEVNQ